MVGMPGSGLLLARFRSCVFLSSSFSSSSSATSSHVLSTTKNQVTTIAMNNPSKYNPWDMEMCTQLGEKFQLAADDDNTKVVIYTGMGKYHCAGGSLSEFIGRTTPRQLQRIIRKNNEKIFNVFIEFPKPIIASVNGPGIGSGITAPALCDVILASDTATFLAPFARLGVGPEGCASVHFPRILGEEAARRLLEDCWSPTAEEAKMIGLVEEVVPRDLLQDRAQELGEQWIREGRVRGIRGGSTVEEFKAINAVESAALAQAFVSEKFLASQLSLLKRRGKHKSVAGFLIRSLIVTRPLWVRFTDS